MESYIFPNEWQCCSTASGLPPCHPSIHTFSRARGRDSVKCINTQVSIYVLYKKSGFQHARVSRPGGEQERFAPFLPCMDSISHNGTGNQPPGCGKARGGTDRGAAHDCRHTPVRRAATRHSRP